ncbi:hypothetical protein HQ34_02935 [Porphyromonas cangingivalis]|nr:hypothetical protein HQ34_02935 [Porphyromonas cangingivalis]
MIQVQSDRVSELKFVFSQSYVGNVDPCFYDIMLIYCLEEIYVDGKKLDDFQPLVLYFEGKMNEVK